MNFIVEEMSILIDVEVFFIKTCMAADSLKIKQLLLNLRQGSFSAAEEQVAPNK